MLKGYRFTLLYLILTLGLHLLFRGLYLKASMSVVEYISFSFAGFSFIKAFLEIEAHEKWVNILRTLFLLVIVAKLDYTYYNKLMPFCLIGLTIYFLISMNFDHLIGRRLLSILSLTLVVILIPSKNILAYTYNRLKVNGEQLVWGDFKDAPNHESPHTAHIDANLVYEISNVYDYPPGIVLSYMEPYGSWVKMESDEPSYDLLLAHEQTHFHIAEYCAQLANDSLKSNIFTKTNAQLIINHFYYKMYDLQREYDSLTNHGVRVDIQFEWTKDLKSKLGIPSLPTDIENIPYTLDRVKTDNF